MATLFISDLHLTASRPEITAAFLDFLGTRARGCDALYILGDLFEYWVGDEAIHFDDVAPVVAALKSLSDEGTPLYIMRGNRDLLFGAAFAGAIGATLLDDPCVVDLYGQPTLLSHGDYLCTDDVEHQKFRAMVHDPAYQKTFLEKPLAERDAIIQGFRDMSKSATAMKPEEIMDVNRDAVREAMQQHGVRRFIHGHTHRPAIHELSIDGQPAKRIVLGDWYTQGSVVVCDAWDCRLQTIPFSQD
jgi:UDP-2,3-diacylglucosamine hydrolase